MKRLILLFFIVNLSLSASAITIWVSTAGNDTCAGTKAEPLASLQMAVRRVRDLRRLNDTGVKDGARIVVEDGVYYLDEPLMLRPDDSGYEGSTTVIAAAEGAKPVLSGGVKVDGWRKTGGAISGLPAVAKGKVWVTDVPRLGGRNMEFRQMWVNGVKAQRASNLNDGTLERILSVDKLNQSFYIPSPKVAFRDAPLLEMVIHQWWAVAFLRVKAMKQQGDSVLITFHQPESRIEFEHPWPAPYIDKEKKMNGNSAYYFVNSIELLNSPGEWFEDVNNGKLYYWPRAEEDMTQATVVVPVLENIVQIEGNLDTPVSYVSFEGIGFEHAAWMRPSKAGHVPLQAGFYMLDAYSLAKPGTPDKAGLENQAWLGRQSSGVVVRNASYITFMRCRFEHMGGSGIDFISGTSYNTITGCIIRDVACNGIQMGYFGDASFEAHKPYDPADEREVCHHETISNNYITDCTNEDWGCVGIGVGFAHHVDIAHNEVSQLNYTGISLGWGWTKTVNCMSHNRIFANHVHHFAKQMYDVSSIYMLSAQPGTEISNNYFHDLEKAPYAHDPNHYQYIYFDEGSSYMRVHDNWTQTDKFLANANGPCNVWENNGPQVKEEIKTQAGLEDEYKDLLLK